MGTKREYYQEVSHRMNPYYNSWDKLYKGKINFYPCHSWESLSVFGRNGKKTGNPVRLKNLHCDYCGEDLTENGNGSYYTGIIVFQSLNHTDIKMSCPQRKCRKDWGMDFQDQIYGYPDPIVLPDLFKDHITYLAIFRCLLGNKYKLNQYVPNGVNQQQMKKIIGTEFCGSCNDEYRCQWNAGKFKVWMPGDWSKPPFETLTLPQVTDRVNDIFANQPAQQMKLF